MVYGRSRHTHYRSRRIATRHAPSRRPGYRSFGLRRSNFRRRLI